MRRFFWKVLVGLVPSVSALLAQVTVIYDTGFETAQGYDPGKNLTGQRGWLSDGSGGNGLIDGQFVGLGQQAYLGFTTSDTNVFTSVWQPVNFDPAPANFPLVQFSVTFQIVPSTQGPQDDFRWSFYNISGDRLFSLDFERTTGNVSYILQDGIFVPTGSKIAFDGFYDLNVWMDFRRNFWTAFLNDSQVATSQPLTQTNSSLTFGDADAVWLLSDPKSAGNNYMAFDNYRVTAEMLSGFPGYVKLQGITNGVFTLTASGEKNVKYAVDVTPDFTQWLSLGEFTNTNGTFDFEDTTSPGFPRGFYRLRPVP